MIESHAIHFLIEAALVAALCVALKSRARSVAPPVNAAIPNPLLRMVEEGRR